MRTTCATLLAGLLAATSLPVAASSMNHWSLGAEVGTGGYGGSVSYRFHDNLALTAGYTGFTYDDLEYETDDVDYEGDVDMKVYGLTLDYFPFGGRFFLSAGAMRPDIAMSVVGRPMDGQTYEYNGRTYTTDEVGTLEGDVTLGDSIQPYLGLGWRGSHKSGLGVYAKLGAFLTDAEASLGATGAASDPMLRDDIQKEEDDLQDDVDEFGIYPVVSVGIEYTF